MTDRDIFRCRQCGACCQGETTVSLDSDDQQRLAAYLRMPLAEVTEKYLRVTGNVVQMQTVDGHCIFYHQGCTVHAGKPWRCTEWPLHPSLLTDEANFSAIRASCPGISRELDYGTFRQRLAEMLADKSGRNG